MHVAALLRPQIHAPNRDSALCAGGRSLTPGRFALLLGLLIAALYPHVLSGAQSFYFRDYGIFGYPLAKYHRECFWNGEWPVWNSLNSCGIPYLAQWNTLVLYPLSLIYLLLPLPWSLGLFSLGHLLLAGVGMYFLAFSWTRSEMAAAVAGVAFSFNGLTLHCLMWPNNIAGLAWMPFVVLTVHQAAQRGGRSTILAALTGAIQMLSGAPEIILLTWFIVLALLVTAVASRQFPAVALGRIALIIGLVVALAAAQLLPFLQLLAHCQRSANYGVDSWAIPSSGLINLVLPRFRLCLALSGVCYQIGQQWTSSYYPGIGILFLALLALRCSPPKRVWPLWALAAFGLIMAFGEKAYLYVWIHKVVPVLGLIRFPVKFVAVTIFVWPLLAALAVAGLSAQREEAFRRTRRIGAILFATIAALIVAALLFSWWHPYYRLRWNDLFQNALLRIGFLGSLLAVLLTSSSRHRLGLQIAAMLLMVLDVWTHLPNQNPTIPPEFCAPGTPIPERQSHNGRAFVSAQTQDLLYNGEVADVAQDYAGRRAGLFGNLNLIDGIPTADGFYSLYPFEQRQIWSKLFYLPLTNFPGGLADFVGISHLSTNVFDWQTRPSALPLIAAGARPVFVEPREILNRLCDSFDPRQLVYLPLEAKAEISVTNASATRVGITDYRSGRMAADIEAPEAALVTVAETYYDGWQAFVDGHPAKIWRANHAFQAVQVPAGRHHLELLYREKTLRIGTIISICALLGCLVAWFATKPPNAAAGAESMI